MADHDDAPVITLDVDLKRREAPTVIAGGILDALGDALVVLVLVVDADTGAGVPEVRLGVAAQSAELGARVPGILREAADSLERRDALRAAAAWPPRTQ